MDLDKGWLFLGLFLLYRNISKIRRYICYDLTNQNKIKVRVLSTYNLLTCSENEMEPQVHLEGLVSSPAFSVRRLRNIRSDRVRNSAVPHASFHLAQMDSVTCTGLPCFLHLFKLSVYLDLTSTSQVALMILYISTSHDKYFYKES